MISHYYIRVPVSIFKINSPLKSLFKGLLEGFRELVSTLTEANKKFTIQYKKFQHWPLSSSMLQAFESKLHTWLENVLMDSEHPS
jgi:hypothetical protein